MTKAQSKKAFLKKFKVVPFDINRDADSEWHIEYDGFYLGSLHRYTLWRNAEGARRGMVPDRKAPKYWSVDPCDDLLDPNKLEEGDKILFDLAQFMKKLKVEAHVAAKGATAVKKWIKAEIRCFLGGYVSKVSEDVQLDGELVRTYENGGSSTSQINNYFVEFQGYLFKVPVDAILSGSNMYDTFSTWQKTGMDRYTVPGEWSGLAKGFCVDSEGALKIDETPEGEPERRIVLARCENGRSTVEAAWVKWKKHERTAKAIRGVMGEFVEHLPDALSQIEKRCEEERERRDEEVVKDLERDPSDIYGEALSKCESASECVGSLIDKIPEDGWCDLRWREARHHTDQTIKAIKALRDDNFERLVSNLSFMLERGENETLGDRDLRVLRYHLWQFENAIFDGYPSVEGFKSLRGV